jgi:hypothetical protein
VDFPQFVGPSYTLASIKAGIQKTQNLYLEVNEAEGTRTLKYTPGLRLLSTSGAGPCRGLWEASNGRSFMASGSKLYEITNPASPTDLGDFVTSSGTVSMADNGIDLLCVDGTKGYTFRFATNVFAQIADVDFPTATYCAFIDQYLIVNDANTGNWFLSGLSDAVNWDALDFAAAEAYPDDLIRLMVDDANNVVLFGSKSIELWFDSGEVLFPFSRVQGGYIARGTPGPDSWVKLDHAIIGITQDENGLGMVERFDGQKLVRVSTFAIEELLKAGNLSAATAWAYQRAGHTFYCLNAPGMASTVCLDVSSGQWHERVSGASRHRGEYHCIAGGLHVVGDYVNGNLYELDEDTYSDNGTAIERLRRCPHLSKETKTLFLANVGVDVETGLITDATEPTCAFRISRDGGHTFGTATSHSLGTAGSYKKRVMRARCGSSRDFVIEWSTSAECPITITGANLDVVVGRN